MILALDSSQSSGSIALAEAGRLVYSAYFDIKITHSETLMPQLDAALKFCGATPQDLSGIILCNGPGSFTGLRIGLATAKGIAYGLGIPVTTFNSLQLTALNCLHAERKILAVIDAKMQEVYAALYDPDLGEICPPQVLMPGQITHWPVADCIITGSATNAVAALLQADGIPHRVVCPYHRTVRAEGLLQLADLLEGKYFKGDSLADLEPEYLRESTAQIRKQARI